MRQAEGSRNENPRAGWTHR